MSEHDDVIALPRQRRPSWERLPYGCSHGTALYHVCAKCNIEAIEEENQQLLRQALVDLTTVLRKLAHPLRAIESPKE